MRTGRVVRHRNPFSPSRHLGLCFSFSPFRFVSSSLPPFSGRSVSCLAFHLHFLPIFLPLSTSSFLLTASLSFFPPSSTAHLPTLSSSSYSRRSPLSPPCLLSPLFCLPPVIPSLFPSHVPCFSFLPSFYFFFLFSLLLPFFFCGGKVCNQSPLDPLTAPSGPWDSPFCAPQLHPICCISPSDFLRNPWFPALPPPPPQLCL